LQSATSVGGRLGKTQQGSGEIERDPGLSLIGDDLGTTSSPSSCISAQSFRRRR
jgi:hypothetical protein